MFLRKIWMNRQSEHPARRRLTPVSGVSNTYDVERDEGLILEEGDAFDQKNMNDLEQRISAGFSELAVFTATLKLDGWQHSGTSWTQLVPCKGMLAIYKTSPPWVYKTGVKDTDDQLRDALGQLEDGYLETLDDKIKVTLYVEPPKCDIQMHLQRRYTTDGSSSEGEALEFATHQEVQQMLDQVFGKEG